jgi:arabinofuranosyltransferase
MDSGLVFLPGMIYLFFENRSVKDWWLALLAQIPFIAWELFSLFYFGFPFPNTAYAKLNTGIAEVAMIRQGWLYLIDSFLHDPVTLTACLMALLFALRTAKKPIEFVLPASMALYILYDIRIGGCFMRGRFLTLPLLCAVFIVITLQNKYISRFGVFIALFFVLLNVNSPSPFYNPKIIGKLTRDRIANERGFFLNSNTLIKKISMPEVGLPFHRWAEEGKRLRSNPPESGAIICYAIGMTGFFAGPHVKIIDCLAQSDPLLARLPVEDKIGWQIGHFKRAVPLGYLETVANGVNKIGDKNIAAYYEKLKILTQDPLFSPGRMGTILKMNLGAYDYLIRNLGTCEYSIR